MSLDISDFKLLKPPTSTKKNMPLKNIYKISFDNKTIRKVNPSRIFHDPWTKAVLPNTSAYFDTPTVIDTLKNPIENQTF